jgi:hypothetical protein
MLSRSAVITTRSIAMAAAPSTRYISESDIGRGVPMSASANATESPSTQPALREVHDDAEQPGDKAVARAELLDIEERMKKAYAEPIPG